MTRIETNDSLILTSDSSLADKFRERGIRDYPRYLLSFILSVFLSMLFVFTAFFPLIAFTLVFGILSGMNLHNSIKAKGFRELKLYKEGFTIPPTPSKLFFKRQQKDNLINFNEINHAIFIEKLGILKIETQQKETVGITEEVTGSKFFNELKNQLEKRNLVKKATGTAKIC